jgi:hypothetical protein
LISITLSGLNETIEAVKKLPTTVGGKPVFEEAAQAFSARLRAATPPGYSGRLKDSVIYEADASESIVGYEQGVETSGNPRLDGVLAAKTKGKSVIARRKWVQADDLESVLQEAFDSYADDAVTLLEERLSSGIS